MIKKINAVSHSGFQLIRNLYNWMGTLVHTSYGTVILALFFFIDAIIIFPAGPLLLLFCSEKPERSFFYAFVSTIASVIGGITAFWIGFYIWELVGQQLVALITTPEKFAYLCDQYEKHEATAIILAGLTPLPYQLITLTAGFCHVSFIPFVVCSFIIRGARLFLIATIMFAWGKQVKDHINTYFNTLVFVFISLIALTLFFIT